MTDTITTPLFKDGKLPLGMYHICEFQSWLCWERVYNYKFNYKYVERVKCRLCGVDKNDHHHK